MAGKAISTRASRLSVVKEDTAGTYKKPSTGDDYLCPQDDLSVEFSTEVLESACLTGTIGKQKSIIGQETPSGSFSVYWNHHSGVAGDAPLFGRLLEGALGADEVVVGTEATIASATATTITLGVGEGANYTKGMGIFIKEPGNFTIAPIASVAGDVLTLGFCLDFTPSNGTTIGELVHYKPAEDCHPSFSICQDINKSIMKAVSGARINSFDLTVTAGELVNASYGFDATSFFQDPVCVTSSNNSFVFTDDNGQVTVTVAEDTYKCPEDFGRALESAMEAASSGVDYEVTFSDAKDLKYTIEAVSGTAVFSIEFSNVANTMDALLGFDADVDVSGSLSYTSDDALSLDDGITPTSPGDPLTATSHCVMFGTVDDKACICPSDLAINLSNEITDINSICEPSGVQEKVITSREGEITMTLCADKGETRFFDQFKTGSDVSFAYVGGVVEGGNFVPGKSWIVYVPQASVTAYDVVSNDDVANYEITVTPYVPDSDNPEFFVTWL